MCFIFYSTGDTEDLPFRTPSSPTRRASEGGGGGGQGGESGAGAPEAVDLGAVGRAALERRRDDITVVRQRVIDQPVERGIGRGRGVGPVIGEIAPDLIARRLAPHHPDEVDRKRVV